MNLEKSEKLKIEMFSLKSFPNQHVAPIKESLYLLKESSTPENNLICAEGTASSVVHTWTPQERATSGYYSPYFGYLHHQVGIPIGVDFGRTLWDSYYRMPHIIPESEVVSQLCEPTVSANPLRPIASDELEEIVIVPLRELPRESAKMEISEYIRKAGGRKVYISELAEKLMLDIELIMEIMEELETERRE